MPDQPATKSKDQTFLQGLGKTLGDLGSLMAAPDADMMFLQKLQMVISARIHQGVQQAMPGPQGQSGGQQGPPGQGGMGSPPQGPPGMGPAGGQPGGQLAGPPGVSGVNNLAQPPNPDELRRMIGAGGGQ